MSCVDRSWRPFSSAVGCSCGALPPRDGHHALASMEGLDGVATDFLGSHLSLVSFGKANLFAEQYD